MARTPIDRQTVSSLANRAGSLAETVSNGASRAAGVLVVGSELVNLARKPSLGSAARALGAGLLLVPNPYAKAAGLVLSVLGTIAQMFESPENLKKNPDSGNANGIDTATQPIGVAGEGYALEFAVVVPDGSIRYVVGADTSAQPHSVAQIIQYGAGSFSSYTAPISGGVSITAGNGFDVGGQYQSGNYLSGFGLNAAQSAYINQAVRLSDSSPVVSNGGGDTGYSPSANQDGYSAPDYENLKDNLISIKDAINQRNLSDTQKDNLKDNLKDIFPKNNNGITPRAENRTPEPALAPNKTLQFSTNSLGDLRNPFLNYVDENGNPLQSTDVNGKPIISKDYVPNKTPTPNQDLTKAPVPTKVPDNLPKTSTPPTASPTALNDRFKDPKDCKFSCSALADCFVDLSVAIFDGCNDDGTAKTKQITIQVLPKDKAKTEASFKEFLDIQSRECSLNDRVRTTPDYWLIRRGQIPQAIILFKTTTKQENGEYSYYQLQIPHYNGAKNSKPSIPSYQKGEFMAIYECLDGSQMQVYAASDAEAKRVINAMERYINPRMRMKDKNNIKTGKRGGLAKVSVKPIRLDFSSQGQARSSPDWSIPLK
ncbi:hypothetical protein HCU40_16600 [Pseudanabaena biceps]|nr:hypothetical protein [Pseudanabaena biceps]